MKEFDRLPPALRAWLHQAVLPWSAASALRLWQLEMARHGDSTRACAALQQVEARLLMRDAVAIWGSAHPDAEFCRAASASRGNCAKGSSGVA